jgi:hypothetical protein
MFESSRSNSYLSLQLLLELHANVRVCVAAGSNPAAQIILFILPESSISSITLGVTAAALNNGDSEGVKPYTGAVR